MNTWITVINQWGIRFVGHAGVMAAQAAVLIGVLWLLDRMLTGRVRASVRYGLWMLVLVKLVLSPEFSLPTGVGNWVPQTSGYAVNQTVPVEASSRPARPEAQAAPVSLSEVHPVVTPETVPSVPAPAGDRPVTAAPMTPARLTWQGGLLIGWVLGVVLLSLGLLIRAVSVQRIIRSGQPADERLMSLLAACQKDVAAGQCVELRVTRSLVSPAVCRAWRPVILLPKVLADQFPEDTLRAVLLHELCHVKRADLWVNWAQTLIQVFYFYNPLVWLANTCIRRVREQAVDERVLVGLQGRTQWYSHTLIDIAEAVTVSPRFGMGLIGVAESQTRLHERIKLMKNTVIPKTAGLGALGSAFVVILGMILIPMAGAQSDAGAAPSFKPVDPQMRTDLLQKLQAMATDLPRLYNSGHVTDMMSLYAADAVSLPPEHAALVGKGALHKQLLDDYSKGTRVYGFKDGDHQRIWMCGDLIYTVGSYAVAVTVPDIPGMITDFRTGLMVWQQQPDGSLKIKVDAYNRDPVPKDPMDFGRQAAAADTHVWQCASAAPSDDSMEAVYEQIRHTEEVFHNLFVEHETKQAIDYYMDDATLMVMGQPMTRGKAAILKQTLQGVEASPPLIALKQDSIQMGGNADMVYVVNLFGWTMKNPANGSEFTVAGKGVHVWVRQPDGSWKILLDINNTDAPV